MPQPHVQRTLVLLAAVAFLPAFGHAAAAQRVEGHVVDSIGTVPVGGTLVSLLDGSGVRVAQTRADGDGAFVLTAPRSGAFALEVNRHGYRTSRFPVFPLGVAETRSFLLLVPPLGQPIDPAPLSVADLAREVCGGEGSERVVVLGIVRHEPSGGGAAANVSVSWPAATGMFANLDAGEVAGVAQTDSTGWYAICSLPPRAPLRLSAARGQLTSDIVNLRFVEGGVFVEGEFRPMPFRVWRQDFEMRAPAQRHTRVSGLVVDSATGAALPGAVVEIAATPVRVVTDSLGRFTLDGTPAGSLRLIAMMPGRRPVERAVRVGWGDTIAVADPIRLQPSAFELDPVGVEAEGPSTRRPLRDFYQRREIGAGSYLTREEFETQGVPDRATAIFQRMRGVRVFGNPNYGKPRRDANAVEGLMGIDSRRWVVTMSRGGPRSFGHAGTGPSECPPLVFLDGMYLGNAIDIDVDVVISVTEIEAVEAYGTTGAMPLEFNRPGSSCGVIAVWTR